MMTIKEAVTARVVDLLNNPHTSGTAVAYAALKLAGILWPKQKSIFDEIAAAGVVYGFFRAGDAKPRDTQQPQIDTK
jgi:hypothetical protein